MSMKIQSLGVQFAQKLYEVGSKAEKGTYIGVSPEKNGELKPLQERIVSVAKGSNNVWQNEQIRTELMNSLSDWGISDESRRQIADKLGLQNNQEKGKPLENREVVNVVSVARKDKQMIQAMIAKAITVVTLPPKVVYVLTETIRECHDHPDVIKFIDSYLSNDTQHGDLDAFCKVAALAVDRGNGDPLTLAYLKGLSFQKKPDTSLADYRQHQAVEAEQQAAVEQHPVPDLQTEPQESPLNANMKKEVKSSVYDFSDPDVNAWTKRTEAKIAEGNKGFFKTLISGLKKKHAPKPEASAPTLSSLIQKVPGLIPSEPEDWEQLQPWNFDDWMAKLRQVPEGQATASGMRVMTACQALLATADEKAEFAKKCWTKFFEEPARFEADLPGAIKGLLKEFVYEKRMLQIISNSEEYQDLSAVFAGYPRDKDTECYIAYARSFESYFTDQNKGDETLQTAVETAVNKIRDEIADCRRVRANPISYTSGDAQSVMDENGAWLSPQETKNLTKNSVFRQTVRQTVSGSSCNNTCPLVATINALLYADPTLVQKVSNTMQKVVLRMEGEVSIMGWKFEYYKNANETATFEVKESDLTDEETNLIGDEKDVFQSMSQFEKVAIYALRKLSADSQNTGFISDGAPKHYGDTFEVHDIPKLFGLPPFDSASSGKKTELDQWKEYVLADKTLHAQKPCVVFAGNHFMAVRGLKLKDGKPCFLCVNSLADDQQGNVHECLVENYTLFVPNQQGLQ